MRLKDVSFRDVQGHLLAFPMKLFPEIMDDIPEFTESDYLLLWPFIDHEYGLELAVMGAAIVAGEDEYHLVNLGTDGLCCYDAEELCDEEFRAIDRPEDFGSDVIDMIPDEGVSDDIVAMRNNTNLDDCRAQFVPDVYFVNLEYDGRMEGSCWVLAESVDGDNIKGIVQSDEGDEQLGLKSEEEIVFKVKRRDKRYYCVGQMDKERFAEAIEAKRSSELLKMLTRINNNDVYLIIHGSGKPVLTSLSIGNAYLVTTEESKAAEYPHKYVKDSLLNIIVRADDDDNISGIVINPFTESYIMNRKYFEPAIVFLSLLPDSDSE